MFVVSKTFVAYKIILMNDNMMVLFDHYFFFFWKQQIIKLDKLKLRINLNSCFEIIKLQNNIKCFFKKKT